MLKRFAVIPTGNRPEEYKNIIDWCLKHNTIPVTIATTIEAQEYSIGITVLCLNNINISLWWKQGIEKSWRSGADIVAVFNDDAIPENDWWDIIEREIGDNSGASGLNHANDIMGWAFAIKDRSIVPDERIKWYFTESVIKDKCIKSNGFKLIDGIKVGNTHARSSEDFMSEQINKDRIEYQRLYGNK